jgi:hypothetical protein
VAFFTQAEFFLCMLAFNGIPNGARCRGKTIRTLYQIILRTCMYSLQGKSFIRQAGEDHLGDFGDRLMNSGECIEPLAIRQTQIK